MSPIKNLTERRRLPRIGKLHLGIRVKTKEGVEHPKAVDYFVFDPNHPQYDELVATFGEQPKELRVLFPVDDLEAVASQYYRLYSRSRGLVCKGDGETCDRLIDTDTGGLANRDTKNVTRKEIPCQGRECADYGRRGCGEVMNLQFIIPEVSGFGVWQIDTGSINSIINVNNALDLVKQVYGRISMVPLILALEPKEVTNPDDGKKKTVRVLNIRSMDKMIEAMHKSNLAPLALVDAMFEQEGFTPDEELDLPEVGDTAPFIDLPSAFEKQIEELSKVDLAKAAAQSEPQPTIQETAQAAAPIYATDVGQAEQNATDLWPEDGTEPTVEEAPQAATPIDLVIDQNEAFPTNPSSGMRVKVRETDEVMEWVQVDDKGGRWNNLGVNLQPQTAPVDEDWEKLGRDKSPTANIDTPTTLSGMLGILQKHDHKYGPTWFYKQFSGYTPTSMKDPATVAQAYAEVNEIMGW